MPALSGLLIISVVYEFLEKKKNVKIFVVHRRSCAEGFLHDILLERFNAISLVVRRSTRALAFLYRIVNNGIDCSLLSSQIAFLRLDYLRVVHPHSISISPDRNHTFISSVKHFLIRLILAVVFSLTLLLVFFCVSRF